MQDFIVYVIVTLCVVWVASRVYRSVRQAKEGDNPCAHCDSVCDLRRMYEEKRRECGKVMKKNRKSCCE